MSKLNFSITSMPSSRIADYYLACLDDSVFLDFNNVENSRVCLVRISFDGFGCCHLGEKAESLNSEDSKLFKEIFKSQFTNQDIFEAVVKQAIFINRHLIWGDALKEYNFS